MLTGFSAHDLEQFHQTYQLNQNMRTIPMPAQSHNVQQFRPIQRSHSQQPTIKPSYLTVQNLISQLNNEYISQSTNSLPQSSVPAFPSQQCISIQRQEIKEQPQSPDTARYKTELCRPFEETGQCRYGSKCQFAHGKHEMRGLNRHPRYKTELCRTYHTTGFCSYGQRCNFIHNEEERRAAPVQRPAVLYINNSTGVSPASSINGDLSPSLSPSLSNDDVFSSSFNRLSPTPSFSSDTFSSPPGTPIESPRSGSLTQQEILAIQVFQHLQKLTLH